MTLRPPPSEIDRLRTDAHEQVYQPEPLSARRAQDRRSDAQLAVFFAVVVLLNLGAAAAVVVILSR